MLKIAPLPDTLSGRGRSAIDDPQGVVRVGDILRFVQRYFLTILSAVFVSVVVAGIYLSNAKPIYTARAQVLIDPNTQQYLRPDGVGQLSLDTAQVEGEIALLRSENIALAVIEKFDLTSDPEFQAEEASMISKLFGNAPTASGQPSEQGSSEPGQDAAAEKADEDDGNGPAGPRSFPSPMMGTSGPEIGETSDYAKTRTALDIFLRKLDVRRVGYSYAIDISFNSVDPDKAALIANEVARAYIQDQIETVVQLARQGSNWLKAQIIEHRNYLNIAARTLRTFRAGRAVQSSDADETTVPLQVPSGEDPTATLEELESTVNTYQKIYEAYLQALNEAVRRQSFPVSNARIITEATRPSGKSFPRNKLVLAFGIMVGMLGGVGIAFVRMGLDRSVRSPQQIRKQIGLTCIVQIPRLKGSAAKMPLRVVHNEPFSQFSGALRTLQNAIINADKSQSTLTVGITSALPDEGKSTVAVNLGGIFEVSTGKTLIIDADIHKSTISKTFAPDSENGLVEVLNDGIAVQDCIVSSGLAVPDVLPVVASQDRFASYGLMGSEKIIKLIDDLRNHYRVIIVDLPPLHPIADALALSSRLDGVILAVEWGATPVDLLADVTHSLDTAGANILGAVITKVPASASAFPKRKD